MHVEPGADERNLPLGANKTTFVCTVNVGGNYYCLRQDGSGWCDYRLGGGAFFKAAPNDVVAAAREAGFNVPEPPLATSTTTFWRAFSGGAPCDEGAPWRDPETGLVGILTRVEPCDSIDPESDPDPIVRCEFRPATPEELAAYKTAMEARRAQQREAEEATKREVEAARKAYPYGY